MLHHVNWLIDNLSNAKDDQPLCVSYILGSGECTGTIKKYSGDGGGAAFQMCKGESDVQLFRVSPNWVYRRISVDPLLLRYINLVPSPIAWFCSTSRPGCWDADAEYCGPL